jgi:hypothetical protein
MLVMPTPMPISSFALYDETDGTVANLRSWARPVRGEVVTPEKKKAAPVKYRSGLA